MLKLCKQSPFFTKTEENKLELFSAGERLSSLLYTKLEAFKFRSTEHKSIKRLVGRIEPGISDPITTSPTFLTDEIQSHHFSLSILISEHFTTRLGNSDSSR